MKLSMAISAFLLFLPHLAAAQSSIGFSHPRDLDALLRYRLPEWGYRTTRLEFALDGSGSSYQGGRQSRGAARDSLHHYTYRESERGTSSLGFSQGAAWRWNQADPAGTSGVGQAYRANAGIGASRTRYVSEQVFVRGNASLYGRYDDYRSHVPGYRFARFQRTAYASAGVGVGVGRIRNVTPLLQALRMSERLAATGRAPLGTEAVEEVAAALARAGGYDAVFDRPERRFWADVLKPLVGDGAPLTPFEVFYLRDARVEALGNRLEGWNLLVQLGVQQDMNEGQLPESRTFAAVLGSWHHNLTLEHQVSAGASAQHYRRGRGPATANESSQQDDINLFLEDLRVIADRTSWTNRLNGSLLWLHAGGRQTYRGRSASFSSQLDYYIEDRLTLSPGFRWNWSHSDSEFARAEGRGWSLNCSLSYALGRKLL